MNIERWFGDIYDFDPPGGDERMVRLGLGHLLEQTHQPY